MELTYLEPNELDPKMTLEEAGLSRHFIVRIPFDRPPSDIDVEHVGGQPVNKPNFPKNDVNLPYAPVAVSILFWEASPGCRTVIVNGRAYEKC